MTEFNELSRDHPRPRETTWRRLDPPVQVRGYFANQWHDVIAVDVNDDTRELRVEMPPIHDAGGVDLISHKVLPADLYQAGPGALSAQ
ncbi:MAG: hypothetical protein ABR498_07700 [Candidatus Dormibacteria bacterium]